MGELHTAATTHMQTPLPPLHHCTTTKPRNCSISVSAVHPRATWLVVRQCLHVSVPHLHRAASGPWYFTSRMKEAQAASAQYVGFGVICSRAMSSQRTTNSGGRTSYNSVTGPCCQQHWKRVRAASDSSKLSTRTTVSTIHQ
jgi:hypothetical protein